MRRDPFGARAVAWGITILFVVLLGAHLAARADEVTTGTAAQSPGIAYIECGEYSVWARRFAALRGLEAKLELVIAQMRKDIHEPAGARGDALARLARVVYAANPSPAEAQYQAYKQCWAALGKFGPEV